MRFRIAFAVSTFAVIALLFIVWRFRFAKHVSDPSVSAAPSVTIISGAPFSATPETSDPSNFAPTNVYAHNLKLRKGPGFRVYVRWLRGQMIRTARNINPSFDELDSFVIDVKNGVIHTNVGDLTNFLNEGVTNSPLTKISLSGDGDQLKLHGTLHKPSLSCRSLAGFTQMSNGKC
jgi:hypothetical protein